LNFIAAILLFMTVSAWANSEPSHLYIIADGKMIVLPFAKLEKVDLETINYHPKFVENGKIKYSGYRIRDILKAYRLPKDNPITIVGRTGQFSIELKTQELLEGDSIIATHANGKPVQSEGNGLQIIYDDKTVIKYPHLKQRQFWCWWVRSFILDNKFRPTLNKPLEFKNTLKSELPWPRPYGISSVGDRPILKERKGILIPSYKNARIELLNGNKLEIDGQAGTKLFLADTTSNQNGGHVLHQVIEKDGQINTILANHYFLKSLEVTE